MSTLELDDDGRNELIQTGLKKFAEEMKSAMVDATASTMVGDQAVRVGPAVRIVEQAIEGTAAIMKNLQYPQVDTGRLELGCLVAGHLAGAWLAVNVRTEGSIAMANNRDICKDALGIVDTMIELVRKGA